MSLDLDAEWQSLSVGDVPGIIKLRRVGSGCRFAWFLGKDWRARPVLRLELPSDDSGETVLPTFKVLNVGFYEEDENRKYLSIELLDAQLVQYFLPAVSGLIQAVENERPAEISVCDTVVRILKRWRHLFDEPRNDLLTQNEQVGLWGELFFLEVLLRDEQVCNAAVASWHGSLPGEQDFLLNGTAYEIKTQLATVDRDIQIASEHQLDFPHGPLYLIHYRLSPVTDSSKGCSLLELVERLRKRIEVKGFPSGEFEMKLLDAGYVDSDEYGIIKYGVDRATGFLVSEEFPRIIASDLASGLHEVRYSLKVADIKNFEVDLSWLKE